MIDALYLDSWLYYIDRTEKHVFIVTYGCHLQPGQEDTDPVLSHEHGKIGLFTRDEIPDLMMPQGYKDSIATWFALLDSTAAAVDLAQADQRVCPTCHVTAAGPAPTPAGEQLESAAWTWSDPAAATALRSRELGAILRAFRRVHALTQEQMAARLGHDWPERQGFEGGGHDTSAGIVADVRVGRRLRDGPSDSRRENSVSPTEQIVIR